MRGIHLQPVDSPQRGPNNADRTTYVKLQNLSWYKAGFVSRQVLQLLSVLQNWIYPKTGQRKTCIVSNSKIAASSRTTKSKPWQSHLTSETVQIFIQNENASLVLAQSRFSFDRFRVSAKPVLEQQVYGRCKASFKAAGLGSAQSRFWCGRLIVGVKPVF